jgi:hypothetical protein
VYLISRPSTCARCDVDETFSSFGPKYSSRAFGVGDADGDVCCAVPRPCADTDAADTRKRSATRSERFIGYSKEEGQSHRPTANADGAESAEKDAAKITGCFVRGICAFREVCVRSWDWRHAREEAPRVCRLKLGPAILKGRAYGNIDSSRRRPFRARPAPRCAPFSRGASPS